MKNLSIRVAGTVQGVFFRASTKKIADQLGVSGFVRNEPDGTVYIEAEGADDVLQQFVDWCRQGPPRAIVEDVRVNEGDVKSFAHFDVDRF